VVEGAASATIRVDSAVEEGGEVSVFYDPMIAKLIAWAPDRAAAAQALADACRAVEVWPVRTNAAFLARCLDHPDFQDGDVDTGFIPGRLDALVPSTGPDQAVVAAAFALHEHSLEMAAEGRGDQSPWSFGQGLQNFRLNAAPRSNVRLSINGEVFDEPESSGTGLYDEFGGVLEIGAETIIFRAGEAYSFSEPDYAQAHAGADSDGAVTAPMPGRIVSVDAAPGQTVAKGTKLVTLEAMKMEHGLTAPFDGVVAEVNAVQGGQVSEGTVLVRLEAS
jgi:acetyl/propionyl-CoA carboxylase alpha subunit